MSGTRQGGLKAAETFNKRYGSSYRSEIGRKGGMKSRGGGFAANPALARIAGYMGAFARKQRKAKGVEKVIRDGKEVTKILVYKVAGRKTKKVKVNYGNN